MTASPVFVPIGDVCSVDAGPAFKSAYFKEAGEGVPLLRGENIEPGALRWTKTRTWPVDMLAGYEHLLVAPGDLILGMDRPIITTGLKLAMVKGADCPALLVQRVARIRPEKIDGRYLFYWLSAPDFAGHLQANSTGTQLPHVTLRSIRDFRVPRFTDDVERRIVDILDDHLSRLDAAGQYLQAALARARKYEVVALARCRGGETRPLEEVAEIQGGIQKQQKRSPRLHHFPFLRVANVTASGLDLSQVHRIELFEGELERYRLRSGDLLVVEGNGSPSQIGRAAVWDGSIEDCVHQNHLIRVRPQETLLPEYLEAVWNSPQNRTLLTKVSSSTNGLHTLSISKLRPLPIPLPSVDRQRELVAEVDAARAARNKVTREIEAAYQRATALRRTLLTSAFSGWLSGRRSDLDRVQELAGV